MLQAWDINSSYRVLRRMRTLGVYNPLPSRFWDVVPRHYRRLVLFPTRMCTAEATFDFRPFAVIAGRSGIAINAGTAARANTRKVEDYCRTLETDIKTGAIDTESLYVLRHDLVAAFSAKIGASGVCAAIDQHDVCAATATLVKWQDEFDIMFAVMPPLDELVSFHRVLDDEYRLRLQRPAQPVSFPLEERLTMLARYLWYRRGGCAHDQASDRILRPDAHAVRICGDPFNGRSLPPVADTFSFRKQLDAAGRNRQAPDTWSSHIDPEGEAVWIQEYVSERLAGQDPYRARAAVVSRIGAIAPDRYR
jgi:hypothetical protein